MFVSRSAIVGLLLPSASAVSHSAKEGFVSTLDALNWLTGNKGEELGKVEVKTTKDGLRFKWWMIYETEPCRQPYFAYLGDSDSVCRNLQG
ncbi:hypothetical protein HZ326_14551 [Fusarium oxysporum f. sp. albedinis]|nr:hypothetical protein HZ326_14551 [Fusarium oxysporum f. sp. albedinis]